MAQTRHIIVPNNAMKTSYPRLLFVVALAAAGSVYAADPKASNVTISFHESDKFTDARSSFGSSTDQHYLDILSEHVRKVAGKRLAEGQKLEVTINDVDLAGDFRPDRVGLQDVRIIKEIYLPRVKLAFKLLDAEGKVVKEGERKLSDLNFMNRAGIIGRNDPLFYDKNLLSDWVESEFKS